MWGAINGDSTQHRYQKKELRVSCFLEVSRGSIFWLTLPSLSSFVRVNAPHAPFTANVRLRTQSPGPNHRASDNGSPSQNQAQPQTRSMWSRMAARGVRFTLPQHLPPPRHNYLRMWGTTYPPTL